MKIFYYWLVVFGVSACGASSESTHNSTKESEQDEFFEEFIDCRSESTGINWRALLTAQCKKLSSYNLFFNQENPTQSANGNGIFYQLNSELFTDYARKYRYVFIPPNTKIKYVSNEAFEFPVGTALVKVFLLPLNTALPEENIIEIRLLIHRSSGWVGLVYVWKKDLADGILDLDSESIEFSLSHNNENYSGVYRVPSFGSCSICHQYNENMTPIGLKARWLNKDIEINSEEINQLQSWAQNGILAGLPNDLSAVELAPSWKDESKSLEVRVKSYLDINCAHCHREEGAASLSGLKLEFGRKSVDYEHGVCNSAHGWRGGGYDIWPGDSENSSMPLRMSLLGAPDRMPPLGRSLVDVEAVELIKQWIDSMPYQECGI